MTNGNFAFDATPPEIEVKGNEHDCSYLPGRVARMDYRLAFRLSETRYEHLLQRGWRRFGRTLFRPCCAHCQECRGLRIELSAFRATRSQRRCRKRNSDIQLTIRRPGVTPEHLALHDAYHRDMHKRRNWPFQPITQDDYIQSFLEGNFPFAREYQYRLNGRMVALGLVDMTQSSMSSIYFIHDPELRPRGPGTYSLLCEIEEGLRTGRRWLYLGYFIRDCPSMNYKIRFGPNQLLSAFAADHEPANWISPESDHVE
jgi:arginyl-tRNA--protein-N-Asp/Glu arginylyltransferase